MDNDFPPVPDAPDDLLDVGNSCDVCGRNMGLFPVADQCQYCRPVTQDNGDTIHGIAFSPADSDVFCRLPNTALGIDDDNGVSIQSGPYARCTWLNDGPTCHSDGAHRFFIGTGFPFPEWWIKFDRL